MRYAFTSFSCPELSLEQMCEVAARHGYDGVEPRLDSGHGHGVETTLGAGERDRIRARMSTGDVRVCGLGTSCRLADPDRAEDTLETARAAIDLAADVAAPLVRVFGGPIPDGLSRERAREQLVASLQTVAEHATRRDIRVCLETHDAWTDPAVVADVMRRVDHPAIGVLWDVLHPVRTSGAPIDATFAALAPWLAHVHIHDASTRTDKLQWARMGEGDIDHRRILGLLADSGYSGYLSGEWIGWEPHEEHLPRELDILRGYERAVA